MEKNAIAAIVFNRVDYVANNPSSGGFSQHGATIAGVIGARGQYEGMYDKRGNVHISTKNQNRLNNALNSPCDSHSCTDLLLAIYVANQWIGGNGLDPFGSTMAMFASWGTPQGDWEPFIQIPGSGNTFYFTPK
jgi:hypothetical protein